MSEKVDVCIIGGGIVGLFCALELSQAGKTVRVVDKLFTGSSRHNIGDVLFQGYDEESLPFLKMTSDAWKHASETYGVDMGFEKRGSVFLAYNEADAVQFKRDVAQDNAHGFETVYYEDDIEKLREKMGVKGLPEEIIGAKISEEDYVVDTGQALDALRKLLIQNGVRFWGSDEVVDFTVEGTKLVSIRTNTGEECEAENFLITAGVWASKLLKDIGVSVPMRPARCHLLEVSPSGTIPKQLLAKRFRSGDIIIKYQRSGKVLVSYTGAMDQAQATWSNAVDEEAVEWVKEQLPTMLKGLIGPIIHSVKTVTLAITQDGKPFLGKAGDFENVMVAIGFCGKSYAYSAGVGKAAKAVIMGEDPGIDMSLYEVGRKIETNLGQSDDEMTTIIGDKPAADEEASMTTADKPDADPDVTMEVEDLPAADADVTMVLDDKPEAKKNDVTMELGDKPDADSGVTMEVDDLPTGKPDATMEVDGESALKNKKEGGPSFESEGEESALKNKETGSSFVSEGEDGSALGAEQQSKTQMTVEGDESALGKDESDDSSFVAEEGGESALGQEENSSSMVFDEEDDGSALEKEQEGKKKTSMVVDSEEKTALGKKEPKKAKGKLEVDDNPYLGLGAKKKPEKKVGEALEEALAEGDIPKVVPLENQDTQPETTDSKEASAEESAENPSEEAKEKQKKKESKLVYEERSPKKGASKIVYD